jgi:hypothetical protein
MNERFQRAIALIDAENAQDPRQTDADGKKVPQELLYSERLSHWVLRLNPHASESLRLAARSQHICRWKIPRDHYPQTRQGYHQWKNDLKKFHARITGEILRTAGYDEHFVAIVESLNLKSGFPHDPDARTLEDALCLVFLNFQLGELSQKAEPEKIINALRKSWNKMTQQARDAALKLPFSRAEMTLLEQSFRDNQADS